MKGRINEHLNYARNNKRKHTTGEHFNLPGHTWHNMKFSILENVKKNDVIYRQESSISENSILFTMDLISGL